LPARIEQDAGAHAIHRITERERLRRIGEADTAAGARMTERSGTKDHGFHASGRAMAVVHRSHEAESEARRRIIGVTRGRCASGKPIQKSRSSGSATSSRKDVPSERPDTRRTSSPTVHPNVIM
jgi:hypothetical protein